MRKERNDFVTISLRRSARTFLTDCERGFTDAPTGQVFRRYNLISEDDINAELDGLERNA